MKCAEDIALSCGIPFCRLTVFKVFVIIRVFNSIIQMRLKCTQRNSITLLIQYLQVKIKKKYPFL